MPRIVPIRDLKNTTAISTLCHEDDEPIFVTKNGYDTVTVPIVCTCALYLSYIAMGIA